MKFFDIENIAFTLGGTGVSFLELIGVIAGLTCVVMAGRNSKYNFWVGFAAASTMILGAAYTLWMYKRVVFGAVRNHHIEELTDISSREFLVLALLAFGALGLGLYPQPFTEIMHSSVDELLRHVSVSKIQ